MTIMLFTALKKIVAKKIAHTRLPRGFSLIEMIVASSIFIIVMLVIVGAMISLDSASRKARTIRTTMDNVSAAADSISRNVRMGSYYHCGCGGVSDPGYPTIPQDCPMTDRDGNGGDVCLGFESQQGDLGSSGDQIVYRLNNNRIERSRDSGVTFVPLTAPEIKINDLRFYVYGTTLNLTQPVVTKVIRGVATLNGKTVTDVNLETTIGSRTPNYSR